ncbi:hypothetical protein C8J56DRAFT_1005322 [Mycena floridula]|nr:hypothetical protein C8J56DRAFT_1005322 [Mycena floridula]
MGNAPSSSQSLPPLQLCLNHVFTSNLHAVSYPQDAFYQLSVVRPYNTAIHITPAAVVRPNTAEEVAQVVRCAVESNVKVQARSGGHSYANYCLGGEDGALVVDLVNFQAFEMNRVTWEARLGAGTLLADVTKRLHDAGGRAIAHGTCPQVGLGGRTGTHFAPMGSTLDHVQEVQVVLANSTIARASATMNPDIFFAVKGAAAGFGIVTEFVMKTHPEPGNIIKYSLGSHQEMWPIFSLWQSIISDPNLTRKLSTEVVIFPLGMIISGTFFGTKEEYSNLHFESRLGKNANVTVLILDDWLSTVANWAEDLVMKMGGSICRQTWFVIFDLEGGAVNDVPQGATAYAHRDALFYMQSYAIDLFGISGTTGSFLDKINQIIEQSMPGTLLGSYAGYVDPALGQSAQYRYWGSNLARLEKIKETLDPHDMFHNPQSVRPAK